MKLTKRHPLVGTWITKDDDSDVAFTVTVRNGRLQVTGFCRSDGERLKITNTRWDGEALFFDCLTPSVNWKSRHVFRLRKNGEVRQELTTWEIWKKKRVKVGDLPTAWNGSGIMPFTHLRFRRTRKRKVK